LSSFIRSESGELQHKVCGPIMRKLLSILLACLLVFNAPRAFSAIAAGSFLDCGNNNGTGTLTCTFNNVAGNVMIFCGIGDETGGADDAQVPTYNGVSASLTNKTTTSGGNNRMQYSYILPSPATGSHTVSWPSTTNHFLLMGVGTYTGASTSGQPDAHSATNSGADSASFSSSLTTVTDNSWVIVCSGTNTMAAGAGVTQRAIDGMYDTWVLGDSNGVVHPAGSYAFTTTGNSSIGYWIVDGNIAIKPPGSAPAVIKNLLGFIQ
jgi:hypothetical protein